MDKSNYVAPRYVDNMWATKDVDIKTKSYGKNVVSQKGVWKNPQNMV